MTRLEALQASAAAYAPTPSPGIHRIGWRDISADIFEVGPAIAIAVKGTDPENIASIARDMDVLDEECRDHPRLGPLFAGAYDAAEGLLPLVLALAGDRRLIPVGHSLGGQIAVDIAGLVEDEQPGRVLEAWGCDPPKSGWQPLVGALARVNVNILRFAGSIVSLWPFERGVHVRPPMLIGDWSASWVEAHSIQRAVAWEAGVRVAA